MVTSNRTEARLNDAYTAKKLLFSLNQLENCLITFIISPYNHHPLPRKQNPPLMLEIKYVNSNNNNKNNK